MILPKFSQNGTEEARISVLDETPTPILDGYGLPFSPERHREFMQTYLAALAAPPEQPKVVEGEPKDKPAGWWDKANRSGV